MSVPSSMGHGGIGAARVAGALRAEWCKFRTVRSTYWTLIAAVIFMIALAAAEAIVLPGHLSAQDAAQLDAIRVSLGGIHLSQVAFGTLGVLVITSEYGTGTIRATLAAVPQRPLVLAAKTIVFAIVALVVGVVSSFAAYAVFDGLLSGTVLRSSIGDPGVVRAIIGGGLYLTVLGLFGLGLGAVVRSSAGGIAGLFAILFVPNILAELLPQAWRATVGPYVPMEAGSQILSAHQEPGALGPWAGFGVFCLYAMIALGAGFILMTRRDAS